MARSRRARLLVLCALPVLAACNAIVGLGDYQKAECSGGGDCLFDGGRDGNVTPTDGGDATIDVAHVDATGAPPVSWAAWKMPNYDGGPDNLPSYTLRIGDNAIVDQVTKLVWRPVPPQDKGRDVDFAAAAKVCADAGLHWRLPSRIELVSILDLATGKAPSGGLGFANPNFQIEPKVYWTSSSYRDLNAQGQPEVTVDLLGVGFDGAPTNLVKRLKATDTARVICVADQ